MGGDGDGGGVAMDEEAGAIEGGSRSDLGRSGSRGASPRVYRERGRGI